MGRTRRRKKKERWIQHYSSSQKILLVGEGDFSFSVCLATAFGTAINMVATSLDSEEMLAVKYQSSEAHLEELKRQGCVVLHEVDVHNMNTHPTLKNMKFDIIIYNFPHAGHFSWLCERDTELIQKHKELLKGYFTSARKMVSKGGEIHVSHRDDYPYNKWELEKLAGKAGLQLKEKVEFVKDDYPGYHNKRGCHIDSNNTFPLKDCFTFKFTARTIEEWKNYCEGVEKNYENMKKKCEEEVKTTEELKRCCKDMEMNYKDLNKKNEEKVKIIEEWKKYCEMLEKNYKNTKNKCEEEVKTTEELKRFCKDMEMNYEDVKKKYEEKVKTIEEWKKYCEMMEKYYKDVQKKCEEKAKTTKELHDEMEKKYEDMKKKNKWKRNIIGVSMIVVFCYYLRSKFA